MEEIDRPLIGVGNILRIFWGSREVLLAVMCLAIIWLFGKIPNPEIKKLDHCPYTSPGEAV